MKIALVAVALGLIGGIAYDIAASQHGSLGYYIAGLAAIALIFEIGRIQYLNRVVRAPREMTFTSDGIRTRTQFSDSVVNWSSIGGTYRVHGMHIFQLNIGRAALSVPDRALKVEDLTRLEELIAENLPDR